MNQQLKTRMDYLATRPEIGRREFLNILHASGIHKHIQTQHTETYEQRATRQAD